MISLTRLNGKPFFLNALLIETVEATPDTVITLTSNKKVMVQESVAEVVQRATAFLTQSRITVVESNSSGG